MTCPTQLADAWRQRSGKAYRESRPPPPRRPVTPPGDRGRAKLVGQADPAGEATARVLGGFRRTDGRGVESHTTAQRRGRLDAVIASLLFMGGRRRAEVSALEWRDVSDARDGDGVLERAFRSYSGPGKGALCSLPWSSLSPDAQDLSAFREICLGHRTAWLLAFVSDVWAGLRKCLPSASHRKMRRRSEG